MRRVIVFKHVAHEVLGTLNPLLREQGFRIRYVNFEREPEARPSLEKYQGLVVFGGWMGVYEADLYPHIKVECQLIEEALGRNIPVLGICLGSQILAHVLGANVRRHEEKEVGWHGVELTEEGRSDALLRHFRPKEKVFQMHGDTFDIPRGAVHLAQSSLCAGQAFRYGEKAYGLQFHLEVDAAMIRRFLDVPANRDEVEEFGGKQAVARMEQETGLYLGRSLELSKKVFLEFVRLFGVGERSPLARSGHGKPV
ncbi:MAG TPA: type 1 glutamine amidotransferase [Bdellovibrionota bacterium]|jgi:GMP synthase (glutamine-hydrolysing)